jgi:hypothetical protein
VRHGPEKGKWLVNVLKNERKLAIVAALVEGNSIRSIERMTGVHRDTIVRFLRRMGAGCAQLHDELMYGLHLHTVQMDEIWAYVGKKQKRVFPDEVDFGDWYTFVAIDNKTKLVPSYLVARRTHSAAQDFVEDLSYRVENRIQLFSDSFGPYAECVEAAFGADVDYAQIQKVYQDSPELRGRYSPGKFLESIIRVIIGSPDEADISTSFVERNNLTMRMAMHLRGGALRGSDVRQRASGEVRPIHGVQVLLRAGDDLGRGPACAFFLASADELRARRGEHLTPRNLAIGAAVVAGAWFLLGRKSGSKK